MEDGRDGPRLEELRNPRPGGVRVIEEAVAEGEPEPARDVVMTEGVEAQPVRTAPVDRRRREGNAAPAEGDFVLAPVDELAGRQQTGERGPGHVGVQDPAVVAGVVVPLRAPPAADAEVQELGALERREADAPADALVTVVVLEGVLGGLVLPAVDDPRRGVEPGRELVHRLEARHALGAPEALELGGGRRQVQRSVVALDTVWRVEPAEGEGQALAEGRDAREVEPVQADLGGGRLAAELLGAGGAGAQAAEVRIEAVRVTVAVALHLEAGARRQPGRERLEGADSELVEAKVGAMRLGADGRAARELRHHLDVRVVVRGADEEAGDPEARHLGYR